MKVDISNQGIKSLADVDWDRYGKPITELDCSSNDLTSLEGCPNSVICLRCYDNKLTSLEGCPNSVMYLYCRENQLTSLEGCPNSVIIFDCSHNKIPKGRDTFNYIYILNFKKGFDITNRLIITNKAQKTIKKAWNRYWYEPNEQGEIRFAKFAFEHM